MDRRSFFGLASGALLRPSTSPRKALERLDPCCPLCKCVFMQPELKDPLQEVVFQHGKPTCACDPVPGLSFKVQFYREVTVG